MLHFLQHSDILNQLTHHHFESALGVFAQAYEDTLGNDVSSAFKNFLESGQAWALGIGFILGYIVRSFTAY